MAQKHGGYYEGVLQLRNPNKDVVGFIRKQIEENGEMITNEKKVADGVDLYVTSQKFLRVLGKRLKNNFCGELKTSRRIFTRNEHAGKDVYRVSVFFRCFNIKVGEVREIKGEKVKVMSIAHKITVKNLATGKSSSLPWELFE